MKKQHYLLAIALFCIISSKACDICGCGVGSYYLGILPEYNKRFIGLRYQYKMLTSNLSDNGTRNYLTADETYQTAEIWAGINLGKKFRVLTFIPYNFDQKTQDGKIGKMDGLGDIAVMGYYNLLNKKNTISNHLLAQSLWLGVGIKLPTGKYSQINASTNDLNNFQLGTASTDFTLNAAYDIRLQDFGINSNVNYKINTSNKYQYRYGNKLTANILAYYKISFPCHITIAPNMGIMHENAAKDIQNGEYTVALSGGSVTSGILGVETNFKRLSFGVNLQHPFEQALAKNSANAGNRVMLHTSIAF